MIRSHDLAFDLLDLSDLGLESFRLPRVLLSEISVLLSSDPAGEIHVFFHHSDPSGVNGAKLSVLEESDQV